MNQLVTIPNFSEGELIIDVDKTTYEELKITERQKGFKVYTDIKIPKQQISNDLITFFKESDVDFERFVSKKTITKNIVFAKWELKNKEKNIYRKVDEKKLKTTIKV
ncbi:MAG TPA: hypothetical protein VJ895_00485, partial [Candidatus Nanoarchaeia archaeon]|nr:hypothetical protein [Candidatus Nanoarchaeia archaeon]